MAHFSASCCPHSNTSSLTIYFSQLLPHNMSHEKNGSACYSTDASLMWIFMWLNLRCNHIAVVSSGDPAGVYVCNYWEFKECHR